MAFVSSSNNNTISTNEAVNTAHRVSIASTQVNANNSTNIDNLNDAVIYAFFSSVKIVIDSTRICFTDNIRDLPESTYSPPACRIL
ncbi:hypothetical protein Tco_0678672 [Tanacetum coccineum]|uniref:Uncharacterized protein n=1 Tax=Tanacetum coccineum TaxID=301880 RepID=A0ABQ4XFQ1_9ASTR